jgi:xanthine dehydrogenase accessory factor
MTLAHDQIPETALAWHRAGRKVALATVIETWGSAPRQPGALLAISDDGALAGSVSGGCVEGAVAAEAFEAMEDGTCRLLEYGVSDEDAFAVGLACGGTIRIFVEPVGIGEGLPLDTLEALCEARGQRLRMGLAVNLTTKDRALIAVDTSKDPKPSDAQSEAVLQQLARSLSNKMMHTPTARMREAAERGNLDVIDAARTLLDLPQKKS